MREQGFLLKKKDNTRPTFLSKWSFLSFVWCSHHRRQHTECVLSKIFGPVKWHPLYATSAPPPQGEQRKTSPLWPFALNFHLSQRGSFVVLCNFRLISTDFRCVRSRKYKTSRNAETRTVLYFGIDFFYLLTQRNYWSHICSLRYFRTIHAVGKYFWTSVFWDNFSNLDFRVKWKSPSLSKKIEHMQCAKVIPVVEIKSFLEMIQTKDSAVGACEQKKNRCFVFVSPHEKGNFEHCVQNKATLQGWAVWSFGLTQRGSVAGFDAGFFLMPAKFVWMLKRNSPKFPKMTKRGKFCRQAGCGREEGSEGGDPGSTSQGFGCGDPA